MPEQDSPNYISYQQQAIKKALAFDGLSEVEKITGKSYKEDSVTQLLGLMMTEEVKVAIGYF